MIPSIPSDNLYKAITYLGGLLVAVGLVVPTWEREQFTKDQVAFLKDVNALNVQIEIAKPAPDEKNDAIQARRADLEKLVRQNHESHDNWLKDGRARVALREWYAEESFWIGWALVIAGASLWWFRLQRYTDAQVKQDSKGK